MVRCLLLECRLRNGVHKKACQWTGAHKKSADQDSRISERGTKMLQSIAAYKEAVKDNTGGQDPVGFEKVPDPVQVTRAEML